MLGWVSKMTEWLEAKGTEVNPQDPHRGKRELKPTICPLNSTHVP